ncbi:MAG: S9 family peptidase [Gammaproteobacteria bacterium]|nr:S9 family peptidase [Gammaproteobacteria bacterium]
MWLGFSCALSGSVATWAGFDAAAAFGARQDVSALRLSSDGNNVAFIVPVGGAGTAVKTLALTPGAIPRIALYAGGKPDRITGCDWVSNDRLVCRIYWIGPHPDLLPFSRLVAVNADGSNIRLLSKPRSLDTYGIELGGGEVIDWLPEQDGAVLMGRITLPDDRIGSRLGSDKTGLGVERVDTRTLDSKIIQQPARDALHYISDGYGTLRIMAERVPRPGGYESGVERYSYRAEGGVEWQPLCMYNTVDRSGFLPLAVDRDLNVAYGFKKNDGRFALYTLTLDGRGQESLVYARDDVDLSGLLRVGRHRRVVGVTYATDYRHARFIDKSIEQLAASLEKALPARSGIQIVDSSVDESKFLIYSSADVDAGVYYIFDRAAHRLQTFLVSRSALEGVPLAKVRPVSYPAHDGVEIPGYLTLPAGKEQARMLPAIVLPHGGPGSRDQWGFDWLPQYFAAQGYAVLQPNFRGSSGYGDAWFHENGFRSWPIAIGDVLDAGRWLVAQGIADPDRLAVVGWSYGGYAALQSVVVDATLFKAAIAIAPVTDLAALTEQYRRTTGYFQIRDFIGEGPHVRTGSPADNADRIRVPVLMFHGTDDINVRFYQAQMMDKALTAAGVKHELVTFEGLDHGLDDSTARTTMLRRSDAFLRAAFLQGASAARTPDSGGVESTQK